MTLVWIISAVLALVFLMAGGMKLMRTKEQVLEQMGEKMGWINDFSQGQIRTIGMLEVLGAIGLILPRLTGIAEILAPLAAVGLALDMAGAAITHLRRGGEMNMVMMNVVLGVLALFVALQLF